MFRAKIRQIYKYHKNILLNSTKLNKATQFNRKLPRIWKQNVIKYSNSNLFRPVQTEHTARQFKFRWHSVYFWLFFCSVWGHMLSNFIELYKCIDTGTQLLQSQYIHLTKQWDKITYKNNKWISLHRLFLAVTTFFSIRFKLLGILFNHNYKVGNVLVTIAITKPQCSIGRVKNIPEYDADDRLAGEMGKHSKHFFLFQIKNIKAFVNRFSFKLVAWANKSKRISISK